MNKKTVALTRSDYIRIISHIRENYNQEVADILMIEACLGVRLSDVLSLKLSEIVSDNNRLRLEKIEKKTKKRRIFTVKQEIYDYLRFISKDNDKIFSLSARRVQQVLALSCSDLGIDNRSIGSHSFRKFFATEIYNQNHDIYLVSQLLQHGSISTTQKYISVSSEAIEKALEEHNALI